MALPAASLSSGVCSPSFVSSLFLSVLQGPCPLISIMILSFKNILPHLSVSAEEE
jgi:hypothetical protein